ncbi:MAG UNVERIFIED_CONTAM: hypothetical protein LVR29_15970 [Microcystis novacekii LVE1205-3]
MAPGVSFLPQGWTISDIHSYARRNLKLADYYTQSPAESGQHLIFVRFPSL